MQNIEIQLFMRILYFPLNIFEVFLWHFSSFWVDLWLIEGVFVVDRVIFSVAINIV